MPPGRVTRTISSAIRHGSRHVLEHVGGVADVDRAVAERQAHAARRSTVPRRDLAEPGELADVGVEGEVGRAGAPGTRRGSSPGPPPTSSTVGAGEVDVAGELADRVVGQRGVEPGRVGLLVPGTPASSRTDRRRVGPVHGDASSHLGTCADHTERNR